MQQLVGHKLLVSTKAVNEPFDIKDRVLINILEVKEMTSHAGFWIKFSPVAGDYTKLIHDVISLEDGLYGKLGYAVSTSATDFKF